MSALHPGRSRRRWSRCWLCHVAPLCPVRQACNLAGCSCQVTYGPTRADREDTFHCCRLSG
jgi:hypothetical protein